MAVVKGPLHSVGASGRFGPGCAFAPLNGQHIVRRLRGPQRTETTRQGFRRFNWQSTTSTYNEFRNFRIRLSDAAIIEPLVDYLSRETPLGYNPFQFFQFALNYHGANRGWFRQNGIESELNWLNSNSNERVFLPASSWSAVRPNGYTDGLFGRRIGFFVYWLEQSGYFSRPVYFTDNYRDSIRLVVVPA